MTGSVRREAPGADAAVRIYRRMFCPLYPSGAESNEPLAWNSDSTSCVIFVWAVSMSPWILTR